MKKCLLLALIMVNSILLLGSQSAVAQMIQKAGAADNIELYGRFTSAALAKGLKSGIYKLDVATGSNDLSKSAVNLNEFWKKAGANVYANGKYYAYTWTGDGYSYRVNFSVFDENWNQIGETIDKLYWQATMLPEYMVYNPMDQKIYAYNKRKPTFYTIDTTNGNLEFVKELPAGAHYNSLTIDANTGLYYATKSDGNLYSYDLQQNKETLIGSTGYASGNALPSAIDKKTGRMFMFYIPQYGAGTKLLEVDKATAKTTEVINFKKGEMFQHLFVIEKVSENDKKMPDSPTNINITYKKAGEFAATLKATAPTKAYDKATALQGNVTIKFLVDDQEVGHVDNIAPGNEASFEYTFAKEGTYWVKAVASNEFGTSPATQTSTYAGFDTPMGVTEAKLVIAQDGKYTLTWVAPTKGINNGEINTTNLTYKVVRYPANVVEAEATKGTTHTGTITDKILHDYYFGIVAMDGAKASTEAYSNHASYGEGVRLPFVEEFNDDANWGLYKIIDENSDGTWSLETANSRLRFQGTKNQAKDFFFTPAVKMRKGVTYTFNINAQSAFNTTSYMNIYVMDEQAIPQDKDFETSFKPLLQAKVEDVEPTVFNVTYTAIEDGVKYFMFYNFSNPNTPMNVYDFNIFASKTDDAPAEVENMVVVGGKEGVVEAHITFNAPTKNGKGEPLSIVDAIEIYKNDEQKAITRIENVTPGKEVTYVDKTAWQGVNKYRVVCFNENGNSGGVYAEAWVGEDFADQPQNVKAAFNKVENTITITWDKPLKGFHNGYVNFATITYKVQLIVLGEMEDPITWAHGIQENKFVVNMGDMKQFLPASGNAAITFIVVPVTTAGDGVPNSSSVVVGDAYGLPYAESFAGGMTTTNPWGVANVAGPLSWHMISGNAPQSVPLAGVSAQDNDSGMAMFYQNKFDVSEGRLQGPQLNITGAKDPVLTFYVFHRPAADKENNWVMFEGMTEDGNYHTLSEKIAIDGQGWKKHSIHLNEKNADKISLFRIVFRGRAKGVTDFYIDNITITDGEIGNKLPAVTDLKGTKTEDGKFVDLSWTAPDAGNYSLIGYNVYCDGNKISDKYTTDNIYRAEFPNDGKSHIYQVEVIYNEGESNLSNEVEITAGSSIDSANAEAIRVYAEGNNLHIEGNAEYQIFSAAGAVVNNGIVEGETTVTLNKGIYFIHAGNKVTKCVIY